LKKLNNLIYNDYFISKVDYYSEFCYFLYNYNNKSIFIKKVNKKKKNFKTKSVERDKNILILKKYFNTSVYNGNKESFFNYFNIFINNFFLLFLKKNDFFKSYENYLNTYNLFKIKKINFNFNFFIKNLINDFNFIFDIRVYKIPKKYKLKFKKKFNFEIVYVQKNKRLNYLLKLINNYSKKNNFLSLDKNLFWTFVEIIFDPKNSFINKRKLNVYNKILKKLYKKN